MILEDRGVEQKAFLKLQEMAAASITTASDTITSTTLLLKAHNLGQSFNIPWVLKALRAAGLGMRGEPDSPAGDLGDTFLRSLLIFAQHHILRDIKHGARIPIPDSYLLVGVADEGPVYEREGVEDVFMLQEGQIYGECAGGECKWGGADSLPSVFAACIQNEGDDKPVYLKGVWTRAVVRVDSGG